MTNLEMLRTATPEQIKGMFCNKYGDCIDVCPSFLFERCGGGKNGVLKWLNEEAIETKDTPKDAKSDAPKGWIKLKSITKFIDNTLYVKASKIVGIGHSLTIDTVGNKSVTAVYTIGAEDRPFLVHDSANEVIEKIEKA